ncbi:MAG: glycosyltransferase [Lachnospiraceae bacterium]
MKKILVFQQDSVCYNSYLYFAEQLIREWKVLGFAVELFGPNEPLEALERFCGQKFDAMFAFNSDLARVSMEDGTAFLDTIEAPFYDVILDHPLYHHDSLKVPLKQFHVICLDENHKRYIEQFYPHIQSVHVVQMTGSMTEEVPCPIENRSIDVLFTGTYTPPEEVWEAIEQTPVFLKENSKQLIERVLRNPDLTLEEALRQFAKETGDEIVLEHFPLHMQAYFLVDSFVRAKKRDRLIRALLKARIPVTVCGADWEKLDCEGKENLQLGGIFSMEDTYQIMAKAKILVNCMPEFKAGGHDRVYSALLNGCVCLTDPSSLLLKQFSTGKELVFYQPDDLEALPVLVRSLLANPSQLQEIADQGFQCAIKHHTWKQRAEEIASILK